MYSICFGQSGSVYYFDKRCQYMTWRDVPHIRLPAQKSQMQGCRFDFGIGGDITADNKHFFIL